MIPLPGSTAGALVAAPLAANTVGETLNAFIRQNVDKSVEDSEATTSIAIGWQY